MRIFAAVGTQKFPFDRLIDALDGIAEEEGFDIYIQYGNSKQPVRCDGVAFLNADKYQGMLAAADIVVVHGGVGTMRAALSVGVKVVAVPRRAIYGEHVDDHQMEIVTAFAEGGYVVPCYESDRLVVAIREAAACDFKPFDSVPCAVEEELSALAANWGFKPFIHPDGGPASQ